MKNTTGGVKYSQLRLEDYLCENRLEAEDNAGVYSNPTMYEKEGDGARVVKEIPKGGTCESRTEYDLLERMLNPSNLNAAYKKVKRNKGSHGVDGMIVEQLQDYLSTHYPLRD